jgi:uncharacterized protein (TIGR01777 family)
MPSKPMSEQGLDFGPRRRYLVSGGTGFIGSALCSELLAQGHAVTVLTRKAGKAGNTFDSGVRCIAHCRELRDNEHFDVVVNLAGAPVVGVPWTAARRGVLLESRLGTTRQLLEFVRRCLYKPALWIQASAIGFYGSDSQASCNEDTAAGSGFAADLCAQWEALSSEAATLGLRHVVLRLGLVFAHKGGSFPPLALPFRFGLGAVMGSGRQALVWVHLDDVLGAMAWCMRHSEVHGVFNLVAPEAVSYRDFARALAAWLQRPLWLRVPEPPLRLLLGEMATMLTRGPCIAPRRLLQAGYQFRHPDLETALPALCPRAQR